MPATLRLSHDKTDCLLNQYCVYTVMIFTKTQGITEAGHFSDACFLFVVSVAASGQFAKTYNREVDLEITFLLTLK